MSDRINLNELVTDRIIKELEKGSIPWHKPWTGVRDGAYSRSTGKPYSWINQMMLKHTGEYMTFLECKRAGGNVKKGEKSEMVVFYKPYEINEQQPDGNFEKKTVPLLRYINVFHISQCEGIEPLEQPPANDIENILKADEIVSTYLINGPQLEHTASNRACYTPSLDKVKMPLKEQFVSTGEYYSTLFHELIHSTGHPSRLNRITAPASFGSEEYSKEELVAEIGAAQLMLMSDAETESTFKNSVAYVQSWVKALRDDKNMIISASSRAEKAVGLMLGLN